jgi:hypothetical protein
MKNISIFSLMLGLMILWSGYSYKQAAPDGTAAAYTLPSQETVDHAPNVTLAKMANYELPEALPSPTRIPTIKEDKPKHVYNLQLVEGISLYDDQQAVIENLGVPENIKRDPFTKELEIYQYPGINVGFSLGYVNYVKVLPEAGVIQIDSSTIPMTLEAVSGELGKPDFIAEDGLVFKRQQAVIKLFIDAETGRLTSIDYFHRTNS